MVGRWHTLENTQPGAGRGAKLQAAGATLNRSLRQSNLAKYTVGPEGCLIQYICFWNTTLNSQKCRQGFMCTGMFSETGAIILHLKQLL